MPKTKNRPVSPYAADAIELLGQLLRKSRIERRMTTADVAVRSGISRGLLHRIESGDPTCAIGAAFEVAAVVGLPLFDADPNAVGQGSLGAGSLGQGSFAPTTLGPALAANREVMRLLPRSVRRQRTEVNDDF